MESVHAKSYSSIFSTLAATSRNRRDFRVDNTNPFPSKGGEIINEIYLNGTPLEKESSPAFSLRPSSSTLVSSHLSTIWETTNWPT